MKATVDKVLTVEDMKKELGLHITLKHTGKMKGMQSLSTSCVMNKYCATYAKDPKKVCSKCFAQTMMKQYENLREVLIQNTELLNASIIPNKQLPLVNAAFFRFESFGDIQSENQVINYFNICKKNKHVKFAIWTKNPFIIESVIDKGYKKPTNLQIVLSSPYLNVQLDINKYPFVDKVFTVYDKKFIKANDVEINCGAKSCLACHKCYVKSKEVYINEILK